MYREDAIEAAIGRAKDALARKVVEVTENDSPDIRRMLQDVGVNQPAPWCAAFVYWCVRNVCPEYPRTAWVPDVEGWAAKKGVLRKEPSRGAAILVPDADGVSGHIGLVVGVDKQNVTSIEGNLADAVRRQETPHTWRKNGYPPLYVAWADLLPARPVSAPIDAQDNAERSQVKVFWNGGPLAVIVDGQEVYRGETRHPGYGQVVFTGDKQ